MLQMPPAASYRPACPGLLPARNERIYKAIDVASHHSYLSAEAAWAAKRMLGILWVSRRQNHARLRNGAAVAYDSSSQPSNAMSFVLRLVGTGSPMPFAHFADRMAAAQAAQAAVRDGEVIRAEVYSVGHETVAKAIDAVIRGEGELVEVRRRAR